MFTLSKYSHGTLPDYLHRPYIFRRGQLSRFFFWVPWEVFHTVLCLIICIVRTSFGGDSYRVFFSGFTGKFFTRYSAWLFTSSVHLSKGTAIAFFFLGSLEGFSHGTLPDYLHRPYIFRRGEPSRFCFPGFPGKFFTRNSACFWTVCGAQIDPKTSKKTSLWGVKMCTNPCQNEWKSSPGAARGHPWAPKNALFEKSEKREIISLPRGP
jgi:hypothetical protein